jgi:hypothetical protein
LIFKKDYSVTNNFVTFPENRKANFPGKGKKSLHSMFDIFFAPMLDKIRLDIMYFSPTPTIGM